MDRPVLRDFEKRIGQVFNACGTGENPVGNAGAWTLEECRALPKPPLPEMETADCFELAFLAPGGCAQGIYEIRAEDGFRAHLFAVPCSPNRMAVTIK